MLLDELPMFQDDQSFEQGTLVLLLSLVMNDRVAPAKGLPWISYSKL